jgi:signal transduction histidine kinase/GAF domain-containing protein
MTYRSVALIIAVALVSLTGVALIVNLPNPLVFAQYSGPLILYALLTAFTLVFAAALIQGELSAAPAIGVLAALSLPAEALATTAWAIAIGAAIGGLVIAIVGDRRLTGQRPDERSPRSILLMVARVTLSFSVITALYRWVGGALPINLDNFSQLLNIILFCIAYTAFYLLLFFLEIYGRAYGLKRLIRVNLPDIISALGLPLPLAVLGAHIFNTLGIIPFAICMVGLALAILSPYVISRAQKRMRKQIEELRSLSVMSQAIRANYETRALMNMVYVQVSNLLDTDNFTVALFRPSDGWLEYPLVIRNGVQVEQAAHVLVRNSPIARVLDTQLPLLLSREAQKEGWVRGLAVGEDIYSWLGVPLQAGGSLYGAMIVTSSSANRIFTSDDLRLLNIVAASASVALENSVLYERQIARAQRLSLLNSIVAQLTESLSSDAILDTIVDKATELSGANGVAVLLQDSDGLKTARSLYVSAKVAERLPQLITGKESRQPVAVIVSTGRDGGRAAMRDLMREENIAAWMELPMIVASSRIGTLVLFYQQPQPFDDEDTELLRAFATQAGQSIRNAREYSRTDEALSRRVGQLMALAAISHEMTATLNQKEICSMVLQFALNATYTHIGTVMLKDELGELDVLAQAGYHPLESVSRRDLLRQWVTREALQSGEPVFLPDMSSRPEIKPLMPTIRAQLAAPIVRLGEIIGVITVESETLGAFTQEDKEFITQLSDQAVIAIDNTRLFQGIAETRDRMQLIIDNMSEPLLLIDRTGTIGMANPHVDRLGLHVDLVRNQTVESLLSYPGFQFAEKLGFETADEVRATLSGLGKPALSHYPGASFKIETNGEPTYFQRSILPVRGSDGTTIGLLFVYYDQTESRKLAQAREDFARMIIHDLRGPLTAVTTSLKLMNDIIPEDSEYKQVVETSSTAGRRAIKKLLNRVDSLLDVAKMESGQLELETQPAELATLIDSACVELSPLAHELSVEVRSELPDGFPLLNVDADKVERVLLNLLDNALKFSPEGGFVTMRGYLAGTNGANAEFVRIEVIDQGPGVPEAARATLFDRFVQVQGRSGRRRGSGLGLTFCRLVIESHGGKIWIEDNPEGGSMFVFTLPVFDEVKNRLD